MNGLPGAGKTTLGTALARSLDAWFLSKDAIKEALASSLGNHSTPPELGSIAMGAIWSLVKASPAAVVIGSWWFKPCDLTFARAGIERRCRRWDSAHERRWAAVIGVRGRSRGLRWRCGGGIPR
ncbi:AAA family ATPase [Nocardia sp. NPDC059229]|uniref:AAA family ATPase n=1 Tax=Nocardia sp. NPDC059229 TaxID=3346778 RepID=UPI00367E69E4